MTTSLLRETDQRIVVGAAATLTYTHVDYEGEPTAPSTCTIGITKADGTTVVAAGTATSAGTGTGERTYTLAAQTEPEQLVVTWTADSVARVEYVDVVGGELWSVTYAASIDKAFAAGTWTTDQVQRGRQIAERECYDLTGRRFTPAYQRVRIPGGRRRMLLGLPDGDIRSVREVAEVASNGTLTTWTSTQRSYIAPSAYGHLDLRSGSWPACELIVGYEYGTDRPPAPIVDATIRRAKYWLSRTGSTLLDRATTYSMDGNGGTYRIIQPGAGQTGDPEVDAIYGRYRRVAVGMS